MLHNLDLSVVLGEAAHCISVDLSMQNSRQVTLLNTLVRSFGPKRCVLKDCDPANCLVYLFPGGALDLLDPKPPFSGKQEATA